MEHIELDIVTSLEKFPFSRINFITIRDPKQVWRIGKVNDWIKRYSSCYYIVMSPHGGTHYHLIAGVDKNIIFKPSKGVHFDIQTVGGGTRPLFETLTVDESIGKCANLLRKKHDRLAFIIKHDIPHQCVAMSNMIKKYFLKAERSALNIIKLNKKTREISKVIDYMRINLNEDRQESYFPEKYIDYIYRCPLKSIPNQGHPITSGDGIRLLTLGQ